MLKFFVIRPMTIGWKCRVMPRMPAAPTAQASRGRAVVASPLDDDPSRATTIAFLIRVPDELSQGPLNLPCFPDIVPRVRKAIGDPHCCCVQKAWK
jgi:hypothetical protein